MRVLVTGANGFVGRRGAGLVEGCERRVVGQIGPDTDWLEALRGAAPDSGQGPPALFGLPALLGLRPLTRPCPSYALRPATSHGPQAEHATTHALAGQRLQQPGEERPAGNRREDLGQVRYGGPQPRAEAARQHDHGFRSHAVTRSGRRCGNVMVIRGEVCLESALRANTNPPGSRRTPKTPTPTPLVTRENRATC